MKLGKDDLSMVQAIMGHRVSKTLFNCSVIIRYLIYVATYDNSKLSPYKIWDIYSRIKGYFKNRCLESNVNIFPIPWKLFLTWIFAVKELFIPVPPPCYCFYCLFYCFYFYIYLLYCIFIQFD